MQQTEDGAAHRIVLLGTGGTIAGAAASATDNVGYASAQRGVQALVAAVPALAAWPLEAEQVAQVDSKDMSPAIWSTLVERVRAHLARAEVRGVVITHGTDTLEDTAWLLHPVVGSALTTKPVVPTAGLGPSPALQADGPKHPPAGRPVAPLDGTRQRYLGRAGPRSRAPAGATCGAARSTPRTPACRASRSLPPSRAADASAARPSLLTHATAAFGSARSRRGSTA